MAGGEGPIRWQEAIELYILQGTPPPLDNVWHSETPETYVEMLYRDQGATPNQRQQLVRFLGQLMMGTEADPAAVARAIGLIALIPHPDFIPGLQEAFFLARSRSKERWERSALLALKALAASQDGLPEKSPVRPALAAMWTTLLSDDTFEIAAFQGLRKLDVGLALDRLALLLGSKLSSNDVSAILRGIHRDGAGRFFDMDSKLSTAVATLSELAIASNWKILENALGLDQLNKALTTARGLFTERLEDVVRLLLEPTEPPQLELLRSDVSLCLVELLKKHVGVNAVSCWQVDPENREVLFLAQAGCPETSPSLRRIPFGKHATGRVAELRKSHLIEIEDPNWEVHLGEKFLAMNMHGLYSVYLDVHTEPPLRLVLNYFDEKLDRLELLRDPCEVSSRIVGQVFHKLLTVYASHRVAQLAEQLNTRPTLRDCATTFVSAVANAIPCSSIRLSLYVPEIRRLVEYPEPSSEAHSFSLPHWLANRTTERTAPSIVETSTNREPIYLGAALRRAALPGLAEAGVAGILIGVIELWREFDSEIDMVYTPFHPYLLGKLADAATPFLRTASRKRLGLLRGAQGSLLGAERKSVRSSLDDARADLGSEMNSVVARWEPGAAAKRRFFAFRTFRDSCEHLPLLGADEFAQSEARLALRRAILTHSEVLEPNAIVALDAELLLRLEVAESDRNELVALGMALIPISYANRLAGLIGFEFDSIKDASEAARQGSGNLPEAGIGSIAETVMRMWLEHRAHLRRIFADYFDSLSTTLDQASGTKSELLNFIACGKGALSRGQEPNERSFMDVMLSLERLPSDIHCHLDQECDAWRSFVRRSGPVTVKVKPVLSMTAGPAFRMLLASSMASAMLGRDTRISTLPESRDGWIRVRIESVTNGHSLVSDGREVAKAITRYRGWECTEISEDLEIEIPKHIWKSST